MAEMLGVLSENALIVRHNDAVYVINREALRHYQLDNPKHEVVSKLFAADRTKKVEAAFVRIGVLENGGGGGDGG